MEGNPLLAQTRRRLRSALELVAADRWMLGSIRYRRLKVLLDSRYEQLPTPRYTLPINGFVQQALQDRRPVVITTLSDNADGPLDENLPDWMSTWPAPLFAPVGPLDTPPIGMLTVGCTDTHWYVQDEIDYVGTIALALTPIVLATGGALQRLDDREQEAARLLGEGCSAPEVARALSLTLDEALAVIDRTLRKMSVRSAGEIASLGTALGDAIRRIRDQRMRQTSQDAGFAPTHLRETI